jgi:hypothetical protein
MDNEISQGVKIILERCKTNPEEMTEDYGKWGQLRNAVFDTVENKLRGSAWLRGLTEKEIDLLYEAFSSLHRKVFDDYVMKQILESDEEETLKYKTAGRYSPPWNDPRMLAQNTIQPVNPNGSWVATTQTSNTSIATQSLVDRLKQELGIK